MKASEAFQQRFLEIYVFHKTIFRSSLPSNTSNISDLPEKTNIEKNHNLVIIINVQISIPSVCKFLINFFFHHLFIMFYVN
jgi:hypothetical protein